MTTVSSAKRVLAGLLLLFALSQALVVTKFPHFQTFDSWDECNYAGTCYEKECLDIPAGWSNVPIEAVSFYNQTRNWWIIEGPTSSNLNYQTQEPLPCSELLTGPCGDHTSGSGKYAYVEASGCYGSEFEFYSPTIMYTNESATVSFYYYMYGSHMNDSAGEATLTLSMKALNASSPSWVDVVTFTGPQQTSPTEDWRLHRANVDSLLPATASATAPMAVQYKFRAVTAGTRGLTRDFFLSDIALDDVLFTQSGASNNTTPYVDPTPTPSPTAGPAVPGGGGGDLEDWEIGTIVGSILGGLLLLAVLLAVAVIILLLIISPRRTMQKMRSGSTSSSDNEAPVNPIAPPPTENHRNSMIM
jgi:hypothetical protein